MTENAHARAREWMLDAAIGSLGPRETAQLLSHVAECDSCRIEQEELVSSVAVLRAASVTAPPFLAARTRASLRLQSQQLNGTEDRRRMISIALAFDVGWTVLSIWLMLNAAHWFGFASVSWVWIGAITWFWLLPGLGAFMIVSLRNGISSRQQLGVEGESRD